MKANKAEDQLRYFLADVWMKSKLTPHSRWLEEDPTLHVYVRRAYHLLGGKMRTVLDIASVTAEPTGTGRFTRFLEWIEDVQPFDGVYIESIVSERFENFFIDRGYIKVEYDNIPFQGDVYRLWDKKEEQ